MKTDKIYLVGFMGAGKSTAARALGDRLGWRVEDIDALIEAKERQPIADIFAGHGEAYFRTVERAVLQDLQPERRVVIATGGGTFVAPDNQRLINEDGISIWLDVSFEQVAERLPPDGRRPLATNRASMRALFDTRRTAYAAAHLRLDTSGVPVGELVERILDWMDQ